MYQRIDQHTEFPEYIPSFSKFIRKGIYRSIHIRQYFVGNSLKFFLVQDFLFHKCD
jgi:hypothetical protein